MEALSYDMRTPGQSLVEVKSEVFDVSPRSNRNIVHSHLWTYCRSSGECNRRGLRLVDLDLPCYDPIVEDVKINLEILRGNSRIRMDRKHPSVIREGGDGGMIGCAEISSKY
jgi:hypothetical protein